MALRAHSFFFAMSQAMISAGKKSAWQRKGPVERVSTSES